MSFVKASRVDSLWAQGQLDAVHRATGDATKSAIRPATSAGIVVAVTLIYAIVFIVTMSSSS